MSTPARQPQPFGFPPSVAFGGESYLAVWTNLALPGRPNTIVGTRMAPDGRVLDRQRLLLAYGPAVYSGPVASNGQIFMVLVAVQDPGNYSWQTFGVRVTRDGAVLDSEPLPIAKGYPQAIASNGDGFVAVVSGGSYADDVLAVRLDADGGVVDATPIPIAAGRESEGLASAAWNGASYLIVWIALGRPAQMKGALLSPDGTTSAPFLLTTPGPHVYPSVASVGSEFLVTWRGGRRYRGPIYATRVSAAGEVIDPDPIRLPADKGEDPVVASNGSEYLVTWEAGRFRLFGARIAPDGRVLDAVPIRIGGARTYSHGATVASDGDGFLVAWNDFEADSSVVAARVASSGELLGRTSLAWQANEQRLPAIAFGGGQYLVAWVDSRRTPGGLTVYAARLSSEGQILDGTGILLGTAADDDPITVTWGGSSFLVTWSELGTRVLDAVRVGADGSVLDAEPIRIDRTGMNGSEGTVVSSGNGWLVVWEEEAGSYWDSLFGAFISSSGQPADAFLIASDIGRHGEPSAAWNGSEFLVAWADGVWEHHDLHATRVSATGDVLDPAGIIISDADGRQGDPSVASDGNGFLVTWRDRVSRRIALLGSRIRADGTILDTTPLQLSIRGRREYTSSSVAWTGSAYVVAYARCTGRVDRCFFPEGDIIGTRVTADGIVLDPSGFVVAGSSVPEESVHLAAGPNGTIAVVYQRFAPEWRYAGVERVFIRLLTGQ